MSILVLSNKDNLETRFLIKGLQTLLCDFECQFSTLSDALHTSILSTTIAQILIYVGPVDGNPNYESFRQAALIFQGPVIAYGLWFSAVEVVTQQKLDLFDHVYVEFRELLRDLQQRLGTLHVHWSPHLAFLTPGTKLQSPEPGPPEEPVSLRRYKVLVFLNRSQAQQRFRKNSTAAPPRDLDIEDLYAMTYVDDIQFKSIEELLHQIQQHDYCVCTTYLSHILSWIANRPFISYSRTDKVKFLLNDLDFSFENSINPLTPTPIPRSKGPLDVISITDSVVSKLQWLSQNATEIKKTLDFYHLLYQSVLQQSTLNNLLNWISKRRVLINPVQYPDLDTIYKMTRKYMVQKAKCDPEWTVDSTIEPEQAFVVADLACTKITGVPGSKYLSTFINVLTVQPGQLRNLIDKVAESHSKQRRLASINLNYVDQGGFNGMHRWGWEGVLGLLQQFSNPNGALFDTFLDRTFCWCHPTYKELGIVPYEMPWGGVIHHPFSDRYTSHSAVTMFQNPDFISSLHTCRVIVCLTEYLARQCRDRLIRLGFKDLPVISLLHPTELSTVVFNDELYIAKTNRRILQIGAWYRNTFSIYVAETPPGYVKSVLIGLKMENYYPAETMILTRNLIETYAEGGSTPVGSNRWLMFCCQYIKTHNYLVQEFDMTLEDVPAEFFITISGRSDSSDSDREPFGSTGNPEVSGSGVTSSKIELQCLNLPGTISRSAVAGEVPRHLQGTGTISGSTTKTPEAPGNSKYLYALKEWLRARINSVKVHNRLDNMEYDQIVSQSVVFLDLIDCSASNTIVECIARQTPILIRRLDPVVEYLGEEYPLYFTDLSMIPNLLTSEKVCNARAYLKSRMALIRTETFVNNFRTQVLQCFD